MKSTGLTSHLRQYASSRRVSNFVVIPDKKLPSGIEAETRFVADAKLAEFGLSRTYWRMQWVDAPGTDWHITMIEPLSESGQPVTGSIPKF